MNVATRVAAGVGSVALAGYGAKQFADFTNGLKSKDHAKLQDATADARQQWDTWKAKLDAEFPGGALPSPQDHARLEGFLQQHPAPSFVKVEHEEFTRVRLSASSPVDRDLLPVEFQKTNGYPLAFGGMTALFGLGALISGVAHGGGSPMQTLGLIAGGAVGAGLGAAMVAGGLHGFRVGEGTEGVNALRQEIDNS
jgi:hypothetical protein